MEIYEIHEKLLHVTTVFLFACLYGVLRPTRELFTQMETLL